MSSSKQSTYTPSFASCRALDSWCSFSFWSPLTYQLLICVSRRCTLRLSLLVGCFGYDGVVGHYDVVSLTFVHQDNNTNNESGGKPIILSKWECISNVLTRGSKVCVIRQIFKLWMRRKATCRYVLGICWVHVIPDTGQMISMVSRSLIHFSIDLS